MNKKKKKEFQNWFDRASRIEMFYQLINAREKNLSDMEYGIKLRRLYECIRKLFKTFFFVNFQNSYVLISHIVFLKTFQYSNWYPRKLHEAFCFCVLFFFSNSFFLQNKHWKRLTFTKYYHISKVLENTCSQITIIPYLFLKKCMGTARQDILR